MSEVYVDFEVWREGEDREVSARTLRAGCVEEAAEIWAEFDDCRGDYDIVGGRSTPVVRVARVGEDAFERFEVEGEAVPRYHARRVG